MQLTISTNIRCILKTQRGLFDTVSVFCFAQSKNTHLYSSIIHI